MASTPQASAHPMPESGITEVPRRSSRRSAARADPHRDRLARVPRDARRRVLGDPHRPRARELPDLAAADLGLPRPRRRARPVKQASARANREIGVLDAEQGRPRSTRRASAIIDGELHDQFVVGVIQGGAGTSTNMNANEVITNIALELMGHRQGRLRAPHPIDDVNRSQSTNDVYPTAIKVALAFVAAELLDELELLRTRSPRRPRVPRRAEGRAHAAAGRRADDARPGVPRLRHDARRGPRPAQRDAPVALRDQHGRDRDRHRHHRRPAATREAVLATSPRSPGSTSRPRPTSSRPRATRAPS